MPTTRQKKLAEAIVANSQKSKPLPDKELLVSSGYATSTAESSSTVIIATEGVQNALSTLGFTEDNAKSVTASIMLDDKEASRDRLKAAEMTFKVYGSFAPGSEAPTSVIQNIFYDANIQIATRAYEQNLKKLLANETTPSTVVPEEATPTA